VAEGKKQPEGSPTWIKMKLCVKPDVLFTVYRKRDDEGRHYIQIPLSHIPEERRNAMTVGHDHVDGCLKIYMERPKEVANVTECDGFQRYRFTDEMKGLAIPITDMQHYVRKNAADIKASLNLLTKV